MGETIDKEKKTLAIMMHFESCIWIDSKQRPADNMKLFMELGWNWGKKTWKRKYGEWAENL